MILKPLRMILKPLRKILRPLRYLPMPPFPAPPVSPGEKRQNGGEKTGKASCGRVLSVV